MISARNRNIKMMLGTAMMLSVIFSFLVLDALTDVDTLADDGPDGEDPIVLNGTDDDDVVDLTQGEFADVELTYNAGAGNDVVTSGESRQMISGGDGDDLISTGTGYDIVLGGDGGDTIFADSGYDIIIGGPGGDDLNGGEQDEEGSHDGYDLILADEDDDVLRGGFQSDTLFGGAGADSLEGGNSADYLDGSVYVDRDVTMDDAMAFVDLLNYTEDDPSGPLGLISDHQADLGAYMLDNFNVVFDDNSADTLVGGEGADTLVLGSQDTGTGGTEEDLFYAYTSTSAMSDDDVLDDNIVYIAPVITDFTADEDVLLLLYDAEQYAIPPATANLTTQVSDDGDTQVLLDGDHVVTLSGQPEFDTADVRFVDRTALAEA